MFIIKRIATGCFMKNYQEDRFNNLGRVILMLLFLTVICAHFNRSDKQTYYASQFEQIAEIHADSAHAVYVDFLQVSSFQKNLISFLDKTGFSLFNENFRISVESQNINQRIVLLRKSLQYRKPSSFDRFYYHLFSANRNEPPLFS